MRDVSRRWCFPAFRRGSDGSKNADFRLQIQRWRITHRVRAQARDVGDGHATSLCSAESVPDVHVPKVRHTLVSPACAAQRVTRRILASFLGGDPQTSMSGPILASLQPKRFGNLRDSQTAIAR